MGSKGWQSDLAGKWMIEAAGMERSSPPLSQNCLTLYYLLSQASQSSLLETVSSHCSLIDGYQEEGLKPQVFQPPALVCSSAVVMIGKEKGYFVNRFWISRQSFFDHPALLMLVHWISAVSLPVLTAHGCLNCTACEQTASETLSRCTMW